MDRNDLGSVLRRFLDDNELPIWFSNATDRGKSPHEIRDRCGIPYGIRDPVQVHTGLNLGRIMDENNSWRTPFYFQEYT